MPPDIPMKSEASYAEWRRVDRISLWDRFVVLVCLVLIPSAVAQSLMGLDEKATFALFVPVILAASIAAKRLFVHRTVSPFAILLALTGAIASIVARSFSQLLMGVTLAIAIVVGQLLFVTLSKPRVLRAVSWFALTLLAGGVVGIVYASAGGRPLMDVQVGYRTTQLYLTTFSFASIGNTIRPSGIFDEPGAFAMFVAIVTMFNDASQQNLKLNRALVTLLVFTGSLAGFSLAVWYMLASNDMRSHRKKGIVLILVLAGVFMAVSFVAPTNPVTSALETFYSERLRIEDGRLAGDNRSNQVEDFFRLVDGEMLLRGVKNSIETYDTDDMSSNPFSITYGYGLVISLPYFALLLWLAGATARHAFRNSYASLGLLFILLQRPYVYHMSWSIMIAATVLLVARSNENIGRSETERRLTR